MKSQEKLDDRSVDSLYILNMEKIPANPSSHIALFVKAVRSALRLTQEEFAEIYNCTKGNVSAWENGRHEPTYAVLSDMAVRSEIPLPRQVKPDSTPLSVARTENKKISTSRSSNEAFDESSLHEDEGFRIPQYDTGGAMGPGLILPEQPGIIHGWRVSSEWVEKNARNYTSKANLAIVTGFGDSMRPMFNPGDPLLVDTGVKEVKADAVYFFRIGEEGFIKRLQRIPTEDGIVIKALSQNQEYGAFDITRKMDFEVLAKVIRVWCGTDF